MDLPNTIQKDVEELCKLSQISAKVVKNIKLYESESIAKVEAAEKASKEKTEKLEKESQMKILKAEKESSEKILVDKQKSIEERKEFDQKVERFEALKKEMERCARGAKDKIRLNVGGTLFMAYRDTLLSVEDTLFSHLLGTKEFLPDSDGDYFLDRSPSQFSRILNYLRTHEKDTEGLTTKQLKEFNIEWDYYLLPKDSAFPFKYVSDFDSYGIMSWMEKENPGFMDNAAIVSFSESSTSFGSARVAFDATKKQSNYLLNGWFQIRFHTISISPSYYTLRNDSNDGYPLRNWEFQASNDGHHWIALKKHVNDSSLATPAFSVASWQLDQKDEFYAFFRVYETGPNASGSNELVMSGLEIYGYVIQK